MNIFGIIALGIVGTILSSTVRSYKPEYGMLVGLACGAAVMFFMTDALSELVKTLKELTEQTGLDGNYFKIILKVIGISYLTRFASETAKDAGENALSVKIDAAGKISVLLLTMPVVSGFLRVITEMLERL